MVRLQRASKRSPSVHWSELTGYLNPSVQACLGEALRPSPVQIQIYKATEKQVGKGVYCAHTKIRTFSARAPSVGPAVRTHPVFAGNGICADGAGKIGRALEVNGVLKTLDLAGMQCISIKIRCACVRI